MITEGELFGEIPISIRFSGAQIKIPLEPFSTPPTEFK